MRWKNFEGASGGEPTRTQTAMSSLLSRSVSAASRYQDGTVNWSGGSAGFFSRLASALGMVEPIAADFGPTANVWVLEGFGLSTVTGSGETEEVVDSDRGAERKSSRQQIELLICSSRRASAVLFLLGWFSLCAGDAQCRE